MTLPNKKATSIKGFDFKIPASADISPFLVCLFPLFFGWFGIAPLMVVVREELDLTKSKIGNIIIA